MILFDKSNVRDLLLIIYIRYFFTKDVLEMGKKKSLSTERNQGQAAIPEPDDYPTASPTDE